MAAKADLMESMMRKLDVRDAIADMPSAASVMRGAALRCLTCGHAGECKTWLAENEAPQHAPRLLPQPGSVRVRRRDLKHHSRKRAPVSGEEHARTQRPEAYGAQLKDRDALWEGVRRKPDLAFGRGQARRTDDAGRREPPGGS
jgi:hypothetical protein